MPGAPSWLQTGFVKAMRELGITDDTLLRKEAATLLQMWQSAGRQFHTKNHLIRLLTCLDHFTNTSQQPAVLTVAAWYHGVITQSQTRAKNTTNYENYPASADFALTRLAEMGLQKELAIRVGELILMLEGRQPPPDDLDACVFVDASMSYLGASPQDYRSYCQLMQAEMDTMEPLRYARLRRSLISKLLARDAIFLSPLGSGNENAARQNLEGEYAKLSTLIPGDASGKERVGLRPRSKEKVRSADTSETVVIKGASPRTVGRRPILNGGEKPSSLQTPLRKLSATERKDLEERSARLQAENALNASENGLSSMENVADQFSTLTMRKVNIKNGDYRRIDSGEEDFEEEETTAIPADEEAEETMYSSADDEDSLTEF
ncbi:hypothetical protein [Varibaculum cambriense]|uniref:HD domain-containing protein n=1 Tax=Varibaculum cambriense TaxID=184870 RepID=UPI00255659F8|nr:hypothetical protein [Varibaculum cambriense]MDK8275183.1 hypothetical protein [Varibaculum cambriense]MDU5268062.1 hypothetical protein [Varibaculum cambriense]